MNERLTEIKARLVAATSGPWKKCGAHEGKCKCTSVWSGDGSAPVLEVNRKWGDTFASIRFIDGDHQGTMGARVEAYVGMIEYGEFTEDQMQANKEFVANAPQDISYLLSEIERLSKSVRHE